MRWKKGKLLIALLSFAVLTSCSTVNRVTVKPNHKLLQSYLNNKTEVKAEKIRVNILKNVRKIDNALPVVLPPVVRPFWIVDHVTPDGVFVRGHWVFIKIRGFEWYIQAISNDQNINEVFKENQ